MKRTLMAFASLLVWHAAVLAAEPAEIADFLKKVRDMHVDNQAAGMRSFNARLCLLMSHDPGVTYAKDKIRLNYSWTAPATEEVSFDEEVPKQFRDGLKKGVTFLWRDVAGCVFFDLIGSAQGLSMSSEGGTTTIPGKDQTLGEFKALFDEAERKFKSIELPRLKITIAYEFSDSDGRHRVSCRRHLTGEPKPSKLSYSGFRKVNGFAVPTVFLVETADTKTKFSIEYVSVNDGPAKMEDLDLKEVKAEIAAFEKGWARWSDDEKKTQMEALAELDHELASAAIAKRGLSDRSSEIKVHAAKVLSGMKKDNVVPLLLSAMKPNEGDIKTYVAIVWCLGEIGDPRAVDSLSKDWWNQKVAEYGITAARAKIDALGKIRHKAAIDALVDTFYMTRDDTIGELKGNLHAALKGLTGQDFGLDRRAWRDWWKKNREAFRF